MSCVLAGFIKKGKRDINFVNCSDNRDLFNRLEGDYFEYKNVVILIDGYISEFEDREFDSLDTLSRVGELFLKYGEDVFKKIDGSYILIIYDKERENLYVCRDRTGIKSLYCFENEEFFLFSTKINRLYSFTSIDKRINFDSLALYLQYGYISAPYSVYENVHKLKAGCYVKYDLKSGLIEEKNYWNIIDYYLEPKVRKSEEEILQISEELLKRSVENLLKISSSTPSAFLSGGYDSSIIALFLSKLSSQKIDTYTVGFFESGYDEAPFAKEIASFIGSNHFELYMTSKDARELLPKLGEFYDEPFGDKASLPTMMLLKKASLKRDSIFSGEGGDEVFATAGDLYFYKRFLKIPYFFRKSLSKAMKVVPFSLIEKIDFIYNFPTRYSKWQKLFSSENVIDFIRFKEQVLTNRELRGIFISETKSKQPYRELGEFDLSDHLNQMLAVYLKIYMSNDELIKVSKAASGFGVELFEPFLNRRLMEFLARVDSSIKHKNREEKYILKQIIYKHMPRELLERPKRGFNVPLEIWFRGELRDMIEEYLSFERIKREGIFDPDRVEKFKNGFLEGRREYTKRVWLLLAFEIWYEKNGS